MQRTGRWIGGRGATDRPNSLGLDQSELHRLLDELEAHDSRGVEPRRSFTRLTYRAPTIGLSLRDARGTAGPRVAVACRNLSRGGVCLLHRAFVYPGSLCEVVLPRTDGREVAVSGQIVWCAHRRGMIHELGVRFTTPIEVEEFLPPGGAGLTFEQVQPADLTGRLVHLTTSDAERKVLRHYLRHTSVGVREAESIAEGQDLIDAGCDVVVASAQLADGTAQQLIETLHTRSPTVPVVVVGAATAPVALPGTRCIAIPRPYAQETLLRALGECLHGRRRGAGGGNLERGYIEQLQRSADALEAHLSRQELPACRTICGQIAATAPGMGLTALGALARRAERSLGESGGGEWNSAISALIAACRDTRAAQVSSSG